MKLNIYVLGYKLKFFITRYFPRTIKIFETKRIKKILKANNEIILIHTIGKVGSNTIQKTIEKSSVDTPLFHTHFLNPQNIEIWKKYYNSSERRSPPLHMFTSEVLSEQLKSYSGKIYVISSMREPISRELSSLFQDLLIFKYVYKDENENIEMIMKVVSNKIAELQQELPEEKWFDFEIKKYFKIDVYQEKFDLNKGYSTYQNNNIEMLLIRIEDIKSNLDKGLNELLRPNKKINFDIIDANVADNKFYNKDYMTIKKDVKVDDLDKILNHKFINHFYFDYKDIINKKWSQ